jgi:hypothetical protein
MVNRTRALASHYGTAALGGISRLRGCGMDRGIEVKSAQYDIVMSILTPYMQLAEAELPDLPKMVFRDVWKLLAVCSSENSQTYSF